MVPILCTSLHELYAADEGCRERAQADYRAFIRALQATLAEQTHRTLLLVGGDLAHVGPKFGDSFDAQTKAAELERVDTELLDYVAAGDSAAVLDHIARDEDARRVCGFPPLMAYLDALAAFGPRKGRFCTTNSGRNAQPVRLSPTARLPPGVAFDGVKH